MGFLDLFVAASMPVLKVLLITALGSILALDHFDIMGESVRKQLNNVVYFVFNPALVVSNLAKTITVESIVLLWFMPVNILLTFILGSSLGWVLLKITKAPQHLKGLVLGTAAAGNLGNLPLILLPAMCSEKGSPFGAPDVCHKYGMAYASLSMAIGAIYLWSYVYNIVRVSSVESTEIINLNITNSDAETSAHEGKFVEKHPSKGTTAPDYLHEALLPVSEAKRKEKVSMSDEIIKWLKWFPRKVNLKAIFAPSTTAAIVGFIIGLVPPLQKLMIGATAPLHVIQDSASLLGEAAIPIVTLIIGGNLLRGLKGSGIQPSVILGIIAIRYVLLPLMGIFVVRGAVHFGLVHADPLYQFVLLLQFALPPAMNIGTITQLFGAGQSECSVILLWTYAIASVSLTVWSTFFMWLVS